MQTDSIQFSTSQNLQEIADNLRSAANRLNGEIEKLQDDPFGSIDENPADIAVVISGSTSIFRAGYYGGTWAVQVYVTDLGDSRLVNLISLGTPWIERHPGGFFLLKDSIAKRYEIARSISDNSNLANNANNGCYIATAVYGSYDCPEVWTLRRFRDSILSETWYGRLFIKAYYKISPVLVKYFGTKLWFTKIIKPNLDALVKRLKNSGIEDTPYTDRTWK